MTNDRYIECGKIVNTHGCRGGLKAESWCNSEEDLAELKRLYIKNGEIYTEYKVTKASIFKQFVILEFYGLNDMDEALLLKNKTLYAAKEDFTLEEGEFFLADMIGLDVIDVDSNKIYGKLVEIINRGASDIYVVKTEQGERMIPAVDEFIISIDIERGIFVRPIEGMLD